jgi:hypothetical protein
MFYPFAKRHQPDPSDNVPAQQTYQEYEPKRYHETVCSSRCKRRPFRQQLRHRIAVVWIHPWRILGLSAAFPKAPLPTPPPNPKKGAALALAYLETAIRYEFEFMDSSQPLAFKDRQGRSTPVKAFSVRDEDKNQGEETYRKQVTALFRAGEEFAVDLMNRGDVIRFPHPIQPVPASSYRSPPSYHGPAGQIGAPRQRARPA